MQTATIFRTDGDCPGGGLIPCLDHAVASLPQITDAQIPSFVTLAGKWSDVLFKSYPDWFAPLFTSPAGHRALVALPQSTIDQIVDNIGNETLIQFCLFFQSSIRPHPTDEELVNSRPWSRIFFNIQIAKLYEAITHYVHPDQEAAFSSLQSQFPVHFTFSPLHQQYTIPPEARPKLFPTVDTSLFSPQFDWFVYLLSKYSPVQHLGVHLLRIAKQAADVNSPTLIRSDFSIPDTFIHTNMFSSFDEFLSAKLSAVTSHPNPPAIDDPPLFSYFSKPHPCLPTPESRTPAEYAQMAPTSHFQTHFVHCFLLGTSLLSQQRRDFYTSIDFVRYASQFDFVPPAPSQSLHVLRSSYLYRTYLLTTDIHHLTTHLDTIASQHQLSQTSSPPIHNTPPTFTHPYFPLYLSLGPHSLVSDIPIAGAIAPNFVSTWKIIQEVSGCCAPLVPVLIHILHHIPVETNPIDAYIIECFQEQTFFDQLSTQAQLDNSRHTLGVFCNCFIARSYQRYLEGKDTLHQHFYHSMQTHPKLAKTLEEPNAFHSLLLYPFLRYDCFETSPLLNKHMFLAIHAGFITFTPPSPATPSPSSTLYEALTPVRSVVIDYLINKTHLDSFFPPSERFRHQAMDQVIPHVTDFKALKFTPKPENLVSFIIPSSNKLINKTIATSFPTIQSILYDDLGHIHTISFRPDDGSNDNGNNDDDDEDDDIDLPCQHLYEGSDINEWYIKSALSTLQRPLEPSKFTPTISTATQELIASDENIMALQSHQTTLVQNYLIKHFKALAVTDPPRVQSKLQHVLLKSDLEDLLASSTSATRPPWTRSPTLSQSSNPSKSYPLPPPIHMPPLSSPESCVEFRAKVADWSLELLSVCLLDLHSPQPLCNNQSAASLPSSISTTPMPPPLDKNDPGSSRAPSIETARAVLLPRLHQLIMSMLHLPSHSPPNTVQSDFYDTMISCTLSPMLRIFDTLATLPTELLEPPLAPSTPAP